MKLTQKEAAIERLNNLETEAQKLREIIEQPEQRTPEAGDVWAINNATGYVNYAKRVSMLGEAAGELMHPLEEYFRSSKCTYLGKFSEVYVKIADVRDALNSYGPYVANCSAPAFRKLGIIQD